MSACTGLLLLGLCLPLIGDPEASLKERGFKLQGDVSDSRGPSTSYQREDEPASSGKVVTLVATREDKVAVVLLLTELEPKQLDARLRAACRRTSAGKFRCGRRPKPKGLEIWVCGRALILPGSEPSAVAACDITTKQAAGSEGGSQPRR
jgi:hypothetical protein